MNYSVSFSNKETVIAVTLKNKKEQFLYSDTKEYSLANKIVLFKELSDEDQKICFNKFSENEKLQVLSELSDRQRAKCLAIADDSTFLSYFDKTSFLKECKFDNLPIEDIQRQFTLDQATLLVRLLRIEHKLTIEDEQIKPLLRYLLSEELKQHFERESAGEEAVVEVLKEFEIIQKFLAEETLLQILIFARENRQLMTAGSIGTEARSRSGIRKFKEPKTFEIDPNKRDLAVLLGLAGKGTYKVVKRRLLLSSQGMSLRVTAKQEIRDSAKRAVAEQELKMLKLAVDLPNVIMLLESKEYFSKKKNREILAMDHPLYTKGELGKHFKTTAITQKDKLQLTADILKGVIGLHSRGIIHRDIKPANIFLDQTIVNGKAVLRAIVGDLGAACLETDHPKRCRRAGTPLYFSPDVLDYSNTSDFRSDAWALGITLSEFFTGTYPTEDAENLGEVQSMGQSLESVPAPKDTKSIEYVIWKLLRPNPEERMTPKEALTIVDQLIADEQRRLPLFEEIKARFI